MSRIKYSSFFNFNLDSVLCSAHSRQLGEPDYVSEKQGCTLIQPKMKAVFSGDGWSSSALLAYSPRWSKMFLADS